MSERMYLVSKAHDVLDLAPVGKARGRYAAKRAARSWAERVGQHGSVPSRGHDRAIGPSLPWEKETARHGATPSSGHDKPIGPKKDTRRKGYLIAAGATGAAGAAGAGGVAYSRRGRRE